MSKGNPNSTQLASYRRLRGLVGLIAILVAPLTAFVICVFEGSGFILTNKPFSSISASYHTQAQDLFVGCLVVVGAFMLAYAGSPSVRASGSKCLRRAEFGAAKLGGVAVLVVALFPENAPHCSTCAPPDYAVWFADLICLTPDTLHFLMAVVHFTAIFILMLIFAISARAKSGHNCRWVIYTFCCLGMVLSLGLAFGLRDSTSADSYGVYWAEFGALTCFGIGWLCAGSYEWFGSRWKRRR